MQFSQSVHCCCLSEHIEQAHHGPCGYGGSNYWVESGSPRELILLCAQWLDRIESWLNARERSYWRRYLGQINRRSPIEKATSPLKLILYFADLDETARQMDMLQRALEEARPIANDESLDEEQKRVNLRKTLKAATSAIWASHHSGGKRQHGVP